MRSQPATQLTQLVEDMEGETKEKDGGRAMRYVATVRPAMAAARYVRADSVAGQRGQEGGIAHEENEVEIRSAAGEQQLDKSDRPSGEKAPAGGAIESEEGERPTERSATDETAQCDTRTEDSPELVKEGATEQELQSDEARRRRAVRKLVLNQRKRARLKRTQAARKLVIRAEKQQREDEAALQADRQHQANAAVEQLQQRRQQREGAAPSNPVGERAKVRLVQRKQNDESVQLAEADDGLPTAVVTVADGRREVKLDSGARYSIAGTEWMCYGDRVVRPAPVDYVEGIGGFLLDVVGVWNFKLRTIFNELVEVEACIVEGCTTEFLLGVDFMQERGATMDFGRNELRYHCSSRAIVIPFRTFGEGQGDRIAAERMAVKTRLGKSTVTPVQIAVTAKNGERGIFVPTIQLGSVMLATTVTEVQDGKAWVPAINSGRDRVKLPSKKELGTWIPLQEDVEVLEVNGALRREQMVKWLSEMGDADTPLDNEDEMKIGMEDDDSRTLVKRLLRAYRRLVTDTGDCPPSTALEVEHHVDTGDAAPIMLKRRRQAQREDAVFESNVNKMLAAGVIEEGNGAWGFPVVLVKKRDGEVRFCVDYRALNKITRKDVYPLPRIDETLEALGGAVLFTTLDLKAGYWQIRMAAGDKAKTAFTTKQGLYQFVRMPFGLTNAPSTFQRMMNGVLRGLTWSTCLVYLDDIVVYTRGGIERHVLELACVLERLANAGLTLKLKKCVFATTSMEYLGHELSSEGVRPLDRLVNAVREFPRPQDAVEVKRFVHLAGYYRRFVEGFGALMSPMTKLLRKDAEWEWTIEQETVFEHVKMLLTKKPLLAYPDFRLPFRVVTDASKVGLGACLMQDQGRGWQPIAYASKVNSKAEGNYGITELECLAVVWAIKLFRPYLYGRQFTIVTDHAALKWLMTSANLTGKLHRWGLTLQEFDFEVEYRPGATNVVADALSRIPAKALAAVGRKRRARRQTAGCGLDVQTAAETAGRGSEATNAATAESGVDTASTSIDGRSTNPTTTSGDHQGKDQTTTATADEDREVVTSSATTGRTSKGDLLEGQRHQGHRDAPIPAKTRSREPAESAPSSRPMTRAAKRRADEMKRQTEEGVQHAKGAQRLAERTGCEVEVTVAGDQAREELSSSERVTELDAAITPHLGEAKPAQPPPTTKVRRQVSWDPSVEQQHAARSTAHGAKRQRPDMGAARSEPVGKTTQKKRPATVSAKCDSAQVDGAGKRRKTMATKAATQAGQTTPTMTKEATTPPIMGPLRVDEAPPLLPSSNDGVRWDRGPTLQLTDQEISAAQARSRLVQRLIVEKGYRGMEVTTEYTLAMIKTPNGKRVILPPELWAVVFKESHDSVWSGHLRAPHTFARISQIYWWPNLQREVKSWVLGCQECGSRKARPREVIPPLRSLRGGDVGDRWALDVAGPLPQTGGGYRYVIAAVEYVTRYAVATTVKSHVAENVAEFIMKQVVLKFGPFRELLTDGAPELTGKVIEQLVVLLQADQINPVPYRPQMIGLVERFHRTWKDCVATYMQDESQRDWDVWVDFAVYAYNSGRHSTVLLSPNELMMGRKLRMPNELLRSAAVSEAGDLTAYHQRLMAAMKASHECAERARVKEQERQARYYNLKAKASRDFNVGDRVWLFKPQKGPKASKFVHAWMGPMRIIEPAGYENYLLEREDQDEAGERFLAHVSFLTTYHYPTPVLAAAAADIAAQLEYEDAAGRTSNGTAAGTTAAATTAPVQTATAGSGEKRSGTAVARPAGEEESSTRLVEFRRRRRRNRASQYVLEYELRPTRNDQHPARSRDGVSQWVSIADYERLFEDDRVVEDSIFEEGV
ncbi:hypothetical protein PF008_g22691 [Phytophthora fragariae]|uniref:Reverse transcriptase n=1 Tax=Phytophthora fragariae TaxID=53985 RepID=A0A6G0QT56_9STRA|nr:hypothetical protein PF008_g22691 [Phytophthora fragariae]